MIDSASCSLLKKFLKHQWSLREISANLDADTAFVADSLSYLLEKRYIRKTLGHLSETDIYLDDCFCITHFGLVAIHEYQRSSLHFIFSEIRSWIALLISFAALMISIIALVQ